VAWIVEAYFERGYLYARFEDKELAMKIMSKLAEADRVIKARMVRDGVR
jgi:hypothetical protein